MPIRNGFIFAHSIRATRKKPHGYSAFDPCAAGNCLRVGFSNANRLECFICPCRDSFWLVQPKGTLHLCLAATNCCCAPVSLFREQMRQSPAGSCLPTPATVC